MNRELLDAAIQEIRDYTMKNAELRAAHHFLFDLPLDKKAGKPKTVVMGINPGEADWDWKFPGPTEETWVYDFHEKSPAGRSPGSINWRAHAEFFTNGKPVVFTELFFWSSHKAKFKQRFGSLWKSSHLSFCVNLNRILIEQYKPDSVIFVGVGASGEVAKLFGLKEVHTLWEGNERLLAHYRDELRPWFFTKHWTGAFGFSDTQRQSIKNYIKSVA
jgi:hypothetical protein